MLTVKSDDVTGRNRTYEAIVKGQPIAEPGVPESFKVLVKELQSLCLDIRILNENKQEIPIDDLNKDYDEPVPFNPPKEKVDDGEEIDIVPETEEIVTEEAVFDNFDDDSLFDDIDE